MKVPQTKIGQFAAAFVAEFVCFLIVVANTTAYTHGLYAATFITDMFFSAQYFLMAKYMTEHQEVRSWSSGLGFTLGGACGSLVGIFISKRFLL